jgi:hypothetical protein
MTGARSTCASRLRMGALIWAMAFLTMVSMALADESMLPLSVGNAWRYECQHVQVRYEHAGEFICDRSNPKFAERVLSVVDSVAVEHGVQGRLSALPHAGDASDSEVYYVLGGDAVSLFVSSAQLDYAGMRPQGAYQRTEADQMLVRVGAETEHSSQLGERRPRNAVVSEGAWFRGVSVAGVWWLFEEEYLLWDLSVPPDVLSFLLEAEDYLDWSFWRGGVGADRVNGFPVDVVIRVSAPDWGAGPYTLTLSAGVGIVQISEYVLVEATIHGETISRPTSIEPSPWSEVKMRQLEVRP